MSVWGARPLPVTDDDLYLREARFPALAACGGVFPARGQDRDLEAFTQGPRRASGGLSRLTLPRPPVRISAAELVITQTRSPALSPRRPVSACPAS